MTIDVAGALKTLSHLRQHGFTVAWIDAEACVCFEAPTPPDNVRTMLDVHQQAIAALMKPDWTGLSGLEWRAIYEKLAREHVRSFRDQLANDHNDRLLLRVLRVAPLTAATRAKKRLRQFALAEAYEHVLTEWLNRHFSTDGPPNRCAHCSGSELHSGDPLLPFGVGPHAWVHGRCWEAWRAARRRKAVETLSGYGLTAAGGNRTSCQEPAAGTGKSGCALKKAVDPYKEGGGIPNRAVFSLPRSLVAAENGRDSKARSGIFTEGEDCVHEDRRFAPRAPR